MGGFSTGHIISEARSCVFYVDIDEYSQLFVPTSNSKHPKAKIPEFISVVTGAIYPEIMQRVDEANSSASPLPGIELAALRGEGAV